MEVYHSYTHNTEIGCYHLQIDSVWMSLFNIDGIVLGRYPDIISWLHGAVTISRRQQYKLQHLTMKSSRQKIWQFYSYVFNQTPVLKTMNFV